MTKLYGIYRFLTKTRTIIFVAFCFSVTFHITNSIGRTKYLIKFFLNSTEEEQTQHPWNEPNHTFTTNAEELVPSIFKSKMEVERNNITTPSDTIPSIFKDKMQLTKNVIPSAEVFNTTVPNKYGKEEKLPYKIMFIHIGKAGGETIKSELRFCCEIRMGAELRESCLANIEGKESALSKATMGYTHVGNLYPKAAYQLADTYLYNIRHPVQRTISWFRYVNPYNCVWKADMNCVVKRRIRKKVDVWEQDFFRCFQSVDSFANALIRQPINTSSTNKCSSVAWSKIEQQYPVWKRDLSALHLTTNMKYFEQMTIGRFPRKKVMVVRTEKMWDDMKAIDKLLGGNANFTTEGEAVTHGSEHHKDNNYISVEGTKRLCCALRYELQSYRNLISRSINLNETEKIESLSMSMSECGFSSWDLFMKACSMDSSTLTLPAEGGRSMELVQVTPDVSISIKTKSGFGENMNFGSDNPDKSSALIISYNKTDTIKKETIRTMQIRMAQNTASKESSNNDDVNTNTSVTREKRPKIMFVHIGKTGGETIRSVLRYGCIIRMNPDEKDKCLAKIEEGNESELSKATMAYTHVGKYYPKHAVSLADTYLFSIRHPLKRTVSWFRFVSPYNCVYKTDINCLVKRKIRRNKADEWEKGFFRCFSSVNEFANALTKEALTNPRNASQCSNMAWMKMKKNRPAWKTDGSALHLTVNTKHYALATIRRYPEKDVMVVRTESMWDDMKAIDQQLGGNGNFTTEGTAVTHRSEYFKDSPMISAEGTKRLCCALKDEIDVYRHLILHAINLNESDKRQSLDMSMNQCGFESWEVLQKFCSIEWK